MYLILCSVGFNHLRITTILLFFNTLAIHDNYETASKNKKGSPLTAFTWKIYFQLCSHNVAHVFWVMLHYPSMAKLQQIVYFIDFMYALMHISWNGQHYVRLAFFIFNKTNWNICFTCEVMFNVYSVFDCLKFVGIHLSLKILFQFVAKQTYRKILWRSVALVCSIIWGTRSESHLAKILVKEKHNSSNW